MFWFSNSLDLLFPKSLRLKLLHHCFHSELKHTETNHARKGFPFPFFPVGFCPYTTGFPLENYHPQAPLHQPSDTSAGKPTVSTSQQCFLWTQLHMGKTSQFTPLTADPLQI